MKLGGRERIDDGAALEDLFAHAPVTPNWTMGFLAAVGSGPDSIASSIWVAEILPDSPPAKAELLERLFGAASETLRSTPEIMPPEADKPQEEVVDFCAGYVRGAGMHATWQKDEAARKLLHPFEVLAKPDSETPGLRSSLGRSVAEIVKYWQAKRQVVNPSKVGRNEPCSCGSGKKHKKCCAA